MKQGANRVGAEDGVSSGAAGNAVIAALAAGVRRPAHGVFRVLIGIGAKGSGARRGHLAEGFATGASAFAIGDAPRSAALRLEQGSDGPAAQDVTEDTLLRTEEGNVVKHRDVVDELVVEALRAVIGVQIEGIQRSEAAAGLHYGSG